MSKVNIKVKYWGGPDYKLRTSYMKIIDSSPLTRIFPISTSSNKRTTEGTIGTISVVGSKVTNIGWDLPYNCDLCSDSKS